MGDSENVARVSEGLAELFSYEAEDGKRKGNFPVTRPDVNKPFSTETFDEPVRSFAVICGCQMEGTQ